MSARTARSQGPGDDADLPPIPSRILSRDGVVVETHFPIWRLSGTESVGMKFRIDWDLLDRYPFLTERACHLLKLFLSHQLTRRRASSVWSTYRRLRSFLRWLSISARDVFHPRSFNWSDVSEGVARAFLEWSVKHTAKKGDDFSCLRVFYEWGVAHGYADFQRDILGHLKSIKAPGHATGHNVRFRHPVKGPFSSDELFQIRNALQAKKGTDQ